jgi:LCP family protein required for cell wall assembly
MPWLASVLLLVTILNVVAGCGADPTANPVSAVSPTAPRTTPSPSATLPALPTVPAAAPRTATPGPSDTPSHTPSHTPTLTLTPPPSLTPTSSSTATQTNTPRPPRATITPTETITPTPTPLFSPTPLPTVALSEDVLNIVLVGLDSTRNLRGQNTDVIIVASISKKTKQVSLLSIPRDLWVYIPTVGWNRINVAHRKGYSTDYPGNGPALLMHTIEINFGIPIHHWARVDFQGFARVVDALGGVTMTVACPVNLRYQPPDSEEEEEMILEPGVHHMDGSTALRYVRTRRDGTDFDRARRQHQFLKAMWDQTKDQLKGLDIVPKISELWSALRDSFETDLDLFEVLSLVPVALDLKPDRIRSRYIGPNETTDWTTVEGWQVLLPDYQKIQRVVASLFAPQSTEDQTASEATRVQVRNGTYRHQLAKIAADQLHWEGFDVVDTGLADNPNYKQTQIIVYTEKPQSLELLIRLLGVKAENVIWQPAAGQPADMLIILGNDYDPCR